MSVLEKELKFFDQHKAEWVKAHLGKFVLVKGDELFGVFDSAETAISEGARQFGTDSFLVRKVTAADEEIRIPALTLGLLHGVVA